MSNKYLYMQTIGCQMNVYDAGQIQKGLAPLGYRTTDNLQKADLIILTTCSVREKAEQKAFSFLGRLAGLKRKKPGLIIGVGGCVAQQEGARIMERIPFVDLVFGTRAVGRLPGLIKRIEEKRSRIVDIEMNGLVEIAAIEPQQPENSAVCAFVTIMRGCENYCTYCVVPYVRGPEISRRPEDIIREIETLVGSGVKEVTLLGQNVNSFGSKQGFCSFAELLQELNGIEGLLRIRFTTSHPKDLSDALIAAFQNLDKLCHHIHLPVQSGSDRILKRMNRKYRRADYLSRVAQLRQTCPDIAITSDIIVGFPGESEDDFQETLDLLEAVAYDGLYAFKYSDRPKVPAARYPDKVADEVKSERLQTLLAQQEKATLNKNEALIGSCEELLVEGFSKREGSAGDRSQSRAPQWTGRTSTNKIVHFRAGQANGYFSDTDLRGRLITVKITEAYAHSLWGEPVQA